MFWAVWKQTFLYYNSLFNVFVNDSLMSQYYSKYEQLNFATFSNGFINRLKSVILSLILVTTYAHYCNEC